MRQRPIFVRAAQLTAGALILLGASLARQPRVLSANSADPTFAEDVAPIFYRNCTACHHPGGLAPFSLVEYDSAKAKLDETRDAVAAGVMPPWHAEGPHGVFRNDRRLADAEPFRGSRKAAALEGAHEGAQAIDTVHEIFK